MPDQECLRDEVGRDLIDWWMRVKPAAIGIRAHSGWAAVVAVAVDSSKPRVLDRQRVVVIDAGRPGTSQPYHFAKGLFLPDAEAHIAGCAKTARVLAAKGLHSMSHNLRDAGYEIANCGLLMASGRPVPPLRETLASHAMIHTAEGEFFRKAFADACQQLGIPVTRIRERELLDGAARELRSTPARIKKELAALGRELGPPWTQDQKQAALVAWLLLAENAKRHSHHPPFGRQSGAGKTNPCARGRHG
jgi:hypothetical protein